MCSIFPSNRLAFAFSGIYSVTSARIFTPLWNLIQLKDRTDQPRGTWEEVYRNARRADRIKNELHERDEGELERTGQPLCIYEPYFGEGTWPFLHHTSLYRGMGLVIFMVSL